MPKVSVAQLFEENFERVGLTWVAGKQGGGLILDSGVVNQSPEGLAGHLNFIHPNWIQVLGKIETAYFSSLAPAEQDKSVSALTTKGLACFIVTDEQTAPDALCRLADRANIPVLCTAQPSLQLLWAIRHYLARRLAEYVTKHGVFLEVMGMGVLLTGESGVGKSELALDLISRGSRLVADDIVELHHIAPDTLEGRCPVLLQDFLEVRGLGVLHIRTIFGETAVRPKKNLKLILHLEKLSGTSMAQLDRLPSNAGHEDVMGVKIRKFMLPVAAGRNLAVLVEAAVRNYILQLRGFDSTAEFIKRQELYLRKPE